MKRYAPALWLLALCLLLPSAARGTGTLTIPNTIAAQSGPNISASLLDTNWTTIATYVNVREISAGTLGARPIAGTSGRYYLATDDNGGTFYYDNGSSWVQLAAPVTGAQGHYGSVHLRWATSTATNTQYNGTADYVTLRNPSTGGTVTRFATTTVTNNVLTAGSTADGRDQAAAFTVSSWVHFYYIWNGSTLASLSSTCAPDTTTGGCPSVGGPNLPSGYTHWAYIGPVRFATAGTLNATWIEGAFAHVEPVLIRTCAAGTGAEQSYDISDKTPPNNLGTRVFLVSNINNVQGELRAVSGGRVLMNTNMGGGALGTGSGFGVIPTGQTLFFIGNAGGTFCLQTSGYAIPNNGS